MSGAGDRAGEHPLLVGVLNLTPDSFSDGGAYPSEEAALAAGLRMVEEGARWIDVGGESTRPGARPVPLEEECARVLPVVRALAGRLPTGVSISIDTYKAETARRALEEGARVVNDVSGGRLQPDLLAVAARAGAPIVLGHLRGEPATMMQGVRFDDVVAEVAAELEERVAAARAAGCREIWVDPGIGFGKHLPENLTLIARLGELRARVGCPVMVGVSRKRFIGELTGRRVGERALGTAAAVTAAVLAGAEAVRVHDVAAMADVVRVAVALRDAGGTIRPGTPGR